MLVSFYVLGDNRASIDALLFFVCQLTQKVITKTNKPLLVLDNDIDRLKLLDNKLWTFSDISFIAHDLCISKTDADTHASTAPVLLTNQLPSNFTGIVLNLTTDLLTFNLNEDDVSQNVVTQSTEALPEKLLEIITTDDHSIKSGREKFAYYKKLGLDVQHFPIK